jgi:catechol 2,3-dioxygenase-like lactoylglutathione lyase family enzyme
MSDRIRLTHFGLCVRDIGRAEQFYCNALGFEAIGRMTVDDDASTCSATDSASNCSATRVLRPWASRGRGR